MAETKFNEFIIPSIMGARYITDGLTFNDAYCTYLDGGYCMIGNVVIVGIRITGSETGMPTDTTDDIVSGFPLPLTYTGNTSIAYMSSNLIGSAFYITTTGVLKKTRDSVAIGANVQVAVSGVYIASTASQSMLKQHNYNINLLTYGVPLTVGDDANNLNVPGVYTVRNADGIVNLPEDSQWGRLEVIATTRQDFSFTSEGRIGQLWMDLVSGDLYYRYWNGDEWKPWIKKYSS